MPNDVRFRLFFPNIPPSCTQEIVCFVISKTCMFISAFHMCSYVFMFWYKPVSLVKVIDRDAKII